MQNIAETVRNGRQPRDRLPALKMAGEKGNRMKVREIIDDESGRRWDVFKKTEDQYFYKYYEFFKSCGWRLLGQDGGHEQGFYWSKDAIEYEFGIMLP